MSEITHTGSRMLRLTKPETWPLRPQNSNSSPLTIPEKEWSPEPYRAVKSTEALYRCRQSISE